MRFESVTAHAFGPLRDQTLELAPRLNVICGPNEAGKSTWHAALYAGLCGMRRARGKATLEDQRFTERHRPWDDSAWEVGAVIRLEDGRRMELRHDLAGRVNSRATDADLGRDCSNEIIVDGAPDGARWLGLDRRSFAATACIRQADLLGVLDEPRLLQEHLQRAADSSGADATAAAALARIERFRAEQVGQDRANSTRPLRQAIVAVERARANLAETRERHADYLRLAEGIQEAERAAAPLDTPATPYASNGGTEELRARVHALDAQLRVPIERPRAGLAVAGILGLVLGIAIMSQLTPVGIGVIVVSAVLLGWIGSLRWRARAADRTRAQLRREYDALSRELEDREALEVVEADQDAQRATVALLLERLRCQQAQLMQSLPSVADAEERLTAAEAELTRLQRLDRVLTITHQLLSAAQDRVHRSIAPVLAESIRARLQPISAARYTDVRVDPASLEVTVREPSGAWRSAALLSHGTAEQVYLLLRVALAELLTAPGEVCPLILDDVTTHCDDARAQAVLETLHEISRDRQVILFSQESRVRAWAEECLPDAGDRLIRLDNLAVAPA